MRTIKQTFAKSAYPVMFGVTIGLSQQAHGPLFLIAGFGHRVWRWKLKEAKINIEGE